MSFRRPWQGIKDSGKSRTSSTSFGIHVVFPNNVALGPLLLEGKGQLHPRPLPTSSWPCAVALSLCVTDSVLVCYTRVNPHLTAFVSRLKDWAPGTVPSTPRGCHRADVCALPRCRVPRGSTCRLCDMRPPRIPRIHARHLPCNSNFSVSQLAFEIASFIPGCLHSPETGTAPLCRQTCEIQVHAFPG